MKKIIFLILSIFLWSIVILPVQAEEYSLNDLIPVDTTATVQTEKFNYVDFVFSTKTDEKGNANLQFASIHNNTKSKTAVSINVLMFDQKKKNVGFISYCSDKDYSIESNNGFKLSGGESKAYTIRVTERYFGSGKSVKDVSYIAVLDENKYCQIGGYDKYEGLTMNEILGTNEPARNVVLETAQKLFGNSQFVMLVFIALGTLIVYLVYAAILNSLHYKTHGTRTALCYIPIANIYICVKLAFGKIVAIIYIVFYFISVCLAAFGLTIVALVVSGISSIAFIVDIIKLITKKYGMFILEPAMKKENVISTNSENLEEMQSPLDLSYEDKTISSEDSMDELDVSSGKELDESTEDSSEESDLTKLFH